MQLHQAYHISTGLNSSWHVRDETYVRGDQIHSPTTEGKRLEKPVILRDMIRMKVERRKVQLTEEEEGEAVAPEESSGGGFDDPFLGLEKVSANFNMFIPIDESMKLAKALAKKREKQLRMMKQWEKSKVPLPPPKRRHGDAQMRKLTDIVIPMFSVSVAGRELLKDAQMKVVLGHRYGLIGRYATCTHIHTTRQPHRREQFMTFLRTRT